MNNADLEDKDSSPGQILTALEEVICRISANKTLNKSDIYLLHFWTDEAIRLHNQQVEENSNQRGS